MEDNTELMTVDSICNHVYVIRGQQVMLDCDLARIYGYEVKNLNRQVKRNIERFPEDFMFRLTEDEYENLRCQIVTAINSAMSRSLPYAFTEQGIYMLATVLRGELAEQQSIFIMRAFREMRHYIKQNQQFVTQSEMHFVNGRISEISAQVTNLSDRQKKSEKEILDIRKSIDTLNENFVSDKDLKNYVIYKGQKFEADMAYIEIYQQATSSIYVIDDYMNAKTLQLLSQKQQGVEVVLFTENGHGHKGFLTQTVIEDFVSQYPPLRKKANSESHDRWIVIDYGLTTEQVFHCGTSSKDAGKKLCAINKIDNTEVIHPLIDKMMESEDVEI